MANAWPSPAGARAAYTVLSALTFRDAFRAGASHFGISDLEVFASDTHKFELRYMDRLVGPYPERRDLYRQRSAIHYLDRFSAPVILFQGLEDKIVPPNQAELIVDALRQKGLPVAYVPFEGEQHGFRRAENIKRAIEGEFYFYSRIFGFKPADLLEPVQIDNLRLARIRASPGAPSSRSGGGGGASDEATSFACQNSIDRQFGLSYL